MANPCAPIPHATHHLRRRITHHWRRYHHIHLAAALTVGCVAGPAVIIHLLPPATARPGWTQPAPQRASAPWPPRETPTDVPEPGALWVLAAGVAGMVLVRRTRGIA